MHPLHHMYYNLYLPTDFIQARGDATSGFNIKSFGLQNESLGKAKIWVHTIWQIYSDFCSNCAIKRLLNRF